MLRPFDRIGPRSRFQVHAAPRLISSSRFRSPYQLSTFRVITRVILDWTVTGQINIFKRSIRAIYVCTHVYIYIHVYTRKGTARTREKTCARSSPSYDLPLDGARRSGCQFPGARRTGTMETCGTARSQLRAGLLCRCQHHSENRFLPSFPLDRFFSSFRRGEEKHDLDPAHGISHRHRADRSRLATPISTSKCPVRGAFSFVARPRICSPIVLV